MTDQVKDAAAFCADLVRSHDFPRYTSTLFLPGVHRRPMLATTPQPGDTPWHAPCIRACPPFAADGSVEEDSAVPEPARIIPIPCPFGNTGRVIYVYYVDAPEPALIDIGVHALDSVWYLMGTPRPISINAQVFRNFDHLVNAAVFDVEDAAYAFIRFENGAVVQLEGEMEGFIPMSELSGRRISRPEEAVTVGQTVEATVIDTRDRRIVLSLRHAEQQQQRAASLDCNARLWRPPHGGHARHDAG